MFDRIREDIQSVLERDPAARSRLEVLLCYPGLWAVWFHRVSHKLWRAHLYLPARMLSQFARFLTSVDIHPGALLGRRQDAGLLAVGLLEFGHAFFPVSAMARSRCAFM